MGRIYPWLPLMALLILAVGCKTPDTAEKPAMGVKEAAQSPFEEPSTAPSSQPSADGPSAKDVEARVEKAHQRLKAAGPAGEVVLASIKSHGGLDRWYTQGALGFRFKYEPLDGGTVRNTYQKIDTWSSRAWHRLGEESEKRTLGWDGKQAWSVGDTGGLNPRFWSLTPYYFVGIPFVFADAGIKLTMEAPFEWEGKTYDAVRVNFAEGTGDAPDDYYVVLFDRESRRVGGVRYIVSYKGFFPNGGHTPEKLMMYDGEQTASGVSFPRAFRTFKGEGDAKFGEQVTVSTLSEVSFEKVAPDFFNVPEGATIQEKW